MIGVRQASQAVGQVLGLAKTDVGSLSDTLNVVNVKHRMVVP